MPVYDLSIIDTNYNAGGLFSPNESVSLHDKKAYIDLIRSRYKSGKYKQLFEYQVTLHTRGHLITITGPFSEEAKYILNAMAEQRRKTNEQLVVK
jgi:hypothetical protein